MFLNQTSSPWSWSPMRPLEATFAQFSFKPGSTTDHVVLLSQVGHQDASLKVVIPVDSVKNGLAVLLINAETVC